MTLKLDISSEQAQPWDASSKKGEVRIETLPISRRSNRAIDARFFYGVDLWAAKADLHAFREACAGSLNLLVPPRQRWIETQNGGNSRRPAMTNAPEYTIISPSDINTEFDDEPRVLDTRLAEALEFKRPRTIRGLIKRHESALESIAKLVCRTVRQTSKGGRPSKEYWLTKKQAFYLCTQSGTQKSIDKTIHMVEVFYAVTSGQTVDVKAHRRRLPKPEQKPDVSFSEAMRVITETHKTRDLSELLAGITKLLIRFPDGEEHHEMRQKLAVYAAIFAEELETEALRMTNALDVHSDHPTRKRLTAIIKPEGGG